MQEEARPDDGQLRNVLKQTPAQPMMPPQVTIGTQSRWSSYMIYISFDTLSRFTC